MSEIDKIFAADGQLAAAVPGYQPREAQVTLASTFYQTIKAQELLIAEAGTGTGKTFAYLLPAVLSGKKVIVSTGTKNLQEQLYHKDLPLVKKVTGQRIKSALLKGRSNYLCLNRYKLHKAHPHLEDKQLYKDLREVEEWASRTQSGDVGEVASLAEDSRAIPLVTSTVDNCLGRDCPDYEDCYLVNARKKAQAADLVVINHHLYFADIAVKDTGFGEILPDSDVVVFDEAHQIPDIACEHFGERLSTRQLIELAKDIETLYRSEYKDTKQLGKASEQLSKSCRDFRLAFPILAEKGNWREKGQQSDVQAELDNLVKTLDFLHDVLKANLSRGKELDNCFERATEARDKLALLIRWEVEDVSLWYETSVRHVSLNLTPLSIANRFSRIRTDKEQSWLMTSATLSVDGRFDHFTGILGLKDYRSLELESPFDYYNQSILCIPRYLPEPSERSAIEAMLTVAEQLIEAAQGRCFLLFTSYRVMNLMAKALKKRIANPIFVQGETPKRELLDKYLQHDDPVLLATGSFWEGVDVRGDALKCVLIDKLPFASPDDPLTEARIENCRRKGYNPFRQIQIPRAVITLKQGAGRLIRDVKDSGVLVICDPRLVTQSYGEIFLASLPNMRRTRDLKTALMFLKNTETNNG
ncbi:ATP-dependent DNA helicase [Gayadomonas joobiniege]|uniref:ATP-dependent DNA helicase n=1 Tax=Gayadomonas joobiniege TaxID=1234606 RepID=UPI0003745F97|nr:ATP-dependent DNA helicase [Gayadomonas joobiniege]